VHTLQEVFPRVKPLQNFVPSFGNWGYVVASNTQSLELDKISAPDSARYLNLAVINALDTFDTDIEEISTGINRLDNQLLVELYAKGWSKFQ